MKKYEGKTVKEVKFEDMKLVVTFTDGSKMTVSSEDKYSGVEVE